MSVLLEAPRELLAIKLSIFAVVHSAENAAEPTDPVGASLLQDDEDFVENLMGRLSGDSEDRVNVGAVATAASGEGRSELLVIELPVAVLVIAAEQVLKLDVLENASERLKSLLELARLDGAVTIEIEVLENLLDGLALIV